MQIWTRLTLGFAGTALVVVGLYGAYQLQKERTDLREAVRREFVSTAVALQVAAGHALRDGRLADVGSLIAAVETADAALDVLVLDDGGEVITHGRRAPHVATARGLHEALSERDDAPPFVLRFDEQDGLPVLTGAFVTEAAAGGRRGTVIVVRSLEALQHDLAAEVRATALSLANLVVGLIVAGWMLSYAYVGRPLQHLVQAMRSVRTGDLGVHAPSVRDDEIGAAITEFNAMVDELAEARRRLVVETEARAAFEVRLQHTDKLHTLGQLSAGLAHEIGSPLQVVNGRARALAARADLPDDLRRSAHVLAAESDRITGIVEQLLTCARHARPALCTMPLLPPVRGIVELLQTEAAARHVRLTLRHAPSLPAVTADASQIQQVVMNLLTNALRATPCGGSIEVTLDSGPAAVGEATGHGVSISVADTGHGIPDDVLPHVFEPFFTTETQQGGIGLGLGIVRSIVEAHGGVVSLTTAVGVGTTVTVTLPAQETARSKELAHDG